jgi:hypothetical protein
MVLLLLFLSSCGMMERAGFEKRRYRPGFFIEGSSPPHEVEVRDRKFKTGIGLVSGMTEVPVPVIEISIPKKKEVKKREVSFTRELKINSLSLITLGPHRQNALEVFKKSEHDSDSWAGILLGLGAILIALALFLIFPGINPELAIGIGGAVALIVLLLLALFVGKKKEVKTQ